MCYNLIPHLSYLSNYKVTSISQLGKPNLWCYSIAINLWDILTDQNRHHQWILSTITFYCLIFGIKSGSLRTNWFNKPWRHLLILPLRQLLPRFHPLRKPRNFFTWPTQIRATLAFLACETNCKILRKLLKSVTEYLQEVRALSDALKVVGSPVTDDELIVKILSGLALSTVKSRLP